MAYKWKSPHHWLNAHLERLLQPDLLVEAKNLAANLDADTIQEIYQREMDDDGYFEEED